MIDKADEPPPLDHALSLEQWKEQERQKKEREVQPIIGILTPSKEREREEQELKGIILQVLGEDIPPPPPEEVMPRIEIELPLAEAVPIVGNEPSITKEISPSPSSASRRKTREKKNKVKVEG